MRRGLAVVVGGQVAVALLCCAVLPAGAMPRGAESIAPTIRAGLDGGAVTMADDEARKRIIESVEKRYNARVVKVTETTAEGRRAYELRLLSADRVWTIRVDAESGQELRSD